MGIKIVLVSIFSLCESIIYLFQAIASQHVPKDDRPPDTFLWLLFAENWHSPSPPPSYSFSRACFQFHFKKILTSICSLLII